jgi:ribonuclease P protein component
VAKQFTLSKDGRLKSRKLIDQLFIEGKKFTSAPFRIHYLLNQPANLSLQFGIGVSSKNFKKAADRNRIKRLTKEAWRLQKTPIYNNLKVHEKKLNVFFIYIAKDLPVYKDIYDAVGRITDKLNLIIETSD